MILKCPRCRGTTFDEPIDILDDFSESRGDGYDEHIICKDCNCEFVAYYKIRLVKIKIIERTNSEK